MPKQKQLEVSLYSDDNAVHVIKQQNYELAKALNDARDQNKNMTLEMNFLSKECLEYSRRYEKLRNSMADIFALSKLSLPLMVQLSQHLNEMLVIANTTSTVPVQYRRSKNMRRSSITPVVDEVEAAAVSRGPTVDNHESTTLPTTPEHRLSNIMELSGDVGSPIASTPTLKVGTIRVSRLSQTFCEDEPSEEETIKETTQMVDTYTSNIKNIEKLYSTRLAPVSFDLNETLDKKVTTRRPCGTRSTRSGTSSKRSCNLEVLADSNDPAEISNISKHSINGVNEVTTNEKSFELGTTVFSTPKNDQSFLEEAKRPKRVRKKGSSNAISRIRGARKGSYSLDVSNNSENVESSNRNCIDSQVESSLDELHVLSGPRSRSNVERTSPIPTIDSKQPKFRRCTVKLERCKFSLDSSSFKKRSIKSENESQCSTSSSTKKSKLHNSEAKHSTSPSPNSKRPSRAAKPNNLKEWNLRMKLRRP